MEKEEYISFDDADGVQIKVGDKMTIAVDESTDIEVEVKDIKKKIN